LSLGELIINKADPQNTKPVKAHVWTKGLTGVRLHHDTKLTLATALSGENLRIESDLGTEAEGEIQLAGEFTLLFTGRRTQFSGTAQALYFGAGSGHHDLGELQANNVRAGFMEGSRGYARICALESFNGYAYNGSQIELVCTPPDCRLCRYEGDEDCNC
jgi:hypothetical protein